MSFDTMLGGQSPKTGNAEPVVLYAADGVTPLSSTAFGANRDLNVFVENVSGFNVDGVPVSTSYAMPGPNGTGINGWLSSLYAADTPEISVEQQVTNANNAIVLPAAGANTRNVLFDLTANLWGSGTQPSQTAPAIFQVLDGAVIIRQFNVITNMTVPNGGHILFPRGIRGSINTSMTIQILYAVANISTALSIGYKTLYIP